MKITETRLTKMLTEMDSLYGVISNPLHSAPIRASASKNYLICAGKLALLNIPISRRGSIHTYIPCTAIIPKSHERMLSELNAKFHVQKDDPNITTITHADTAFVHMTFLEKVEYMSEKDEYVFTEERNYDGFCKQVLPLVEFD